MYFRQFTVKINPAVYQISQNYESIESVRKNSMREEEE